MAISIILHKDPSTGILAQTFLTGEASVDDVKTQVVPDGVTSYVIEDSALPADDGFMDAWTYDGSSFGVDMTLAKAVHRRWIRETRVERLYELDKEFMINLEKGESTTAIATKKQSLRDAPAASAIDSATTVAELKSQWDSSILGTSPYPS